MTRYDSAFTVGLEEELHLVDSSTLELTPAAARLLATMDLEPQAAGHEAYAAQIELRSPVSGTVEAAVAALAGHRARALGAGATLLGTGLHPTARYGDAELVDTERYARVVTVVRGLLRRTPEAALHIHVGLPDERSAVRAYNAMRRHLPVLHGLAAHSPWWFGVDSGLASARYAVGRAYPGRGIPPAIRDIEDLHAQTDERVRAAGIGEATLLWGDMRLHPELGTLEVRELDVQSRLDDSAALASLVRAIVVDAARSPEGERPASDILQWSMFHASRDGVGAVILADGARRGLAETARALVARLMPVARDLGDDAPLEGVNRIVAEGGGAGRRRADVARGGVEEMLAAAIRETHESAERGARPSVSRRWLDARSRRDLDALGALTHADAVWESPVDGKVRGRARVVDQVRAGYVDSESFSSTLLSFEQRRHRAVATVRNTGRRNGEVLDSRQELHFEERDGLVASVRIVVDDPDAVAEFWDD